MTLRARNVLWLLPLLLTACAHEPKPQLTQQFAPPVSTVPKPPALHPDLPAAVLVLPSIVLDTNTDDILDAAAKPAMRKRKPPIHTALDAGDSPSTSPSQSAGSAAQQAANDTSEVPALGDLSTPEPSDLRRETSDTLDDTERGLKGISRSLTTQEQKTASQIRQYVRQARKALETGDVSAANILASKAKVLLAELNE